MRYLVIESVVDPTEPGTANFLNKTVAEANFVVESCQR
jgi:hypothetical protein